VNAVNRKRCKLALSTTQEETRVTQVDGPVSTQTPPATRRERQREATFEEIVSVSRELLAEEGSELSLRAVATRMGMTAPALYRYVANYQELVDLVAFEIDKAATDGFAEAASRLPDDDPGGRLVVATVAFRRWAHANPREFSLVFANPIADGSCIRRELLTAATSGHYMNDLLIDVWEKYGFDHPALDELDPAVAAAVADPVFPVKLERIPDDDRGLLWVFVRAWAALYGVVTLEVFGHMDPRIIESGVLFRSMVREWIPRIGLGDDYDRLDALLVEELAR
jgi:AcrR family transcriptional regulator